MAQSINNLPVGAKVKDTGTTFYGKPLVFQIADKNHSGYPANSVTLVTENIIKIMAFDAIEASNSDSSRKSYGNNRYAFSNLRQWLNKEGASWYQAQHGQDAPPSSANVNSGWNPYDTVAGFLTNFSAQMKAALLSTTLTVAKATVDGGGSETATDKIFLLSKQEVGLGAENGVAEGVLLALFNANNTSRVATPTADAVSNSTYTSTSLKVGSGWYWWLRSPYFSYSHHVRLVHTDGSEAYGGAYHGTYGLRPALNLPSSILVSDTVGADGAYTITWNQAPTTPPSISVPDKVSSGKNAAVSWSASIDPEGGAVSYELQCSVNGGTYANIYTGSNVSYNHAITTAMNSVQYRVRAKDNVGEYSPYQTSQARTVIHNVAPGISGNDIDLGVVSEPPSMSFTISDPDAGDTVIADLKLDDNTVQQINPVVQGSVYTFTLTPAQFYGLKKGQHTMKVVAADKVGDSTTRTVTFRRAVTSIDFKITPIATDAKAEKILISLQFYTAAADVQIRVSNNALDANPTWESANAGLKHIFSNTTKTAASWAVGVWVTVRPSAAYPEVYCNALNGSYV